MQHEITLGHSHPQQVDASRAQGNPCARTSEFHAEWKMSCKQFMKFLVGLATGVVMPQDQLWKVMLNNCYGVQRYKGVPGHGGDGFDTRLHAGWVYGPSLHPGKGVLAVALINSDFRGKEYDESAIVDRMANIYLEL